MANQSGWWQFEYHSTDSDTDEPIELTDVDLEHIAELIKDGYTEGEIVKDEEANHE